MSDKNKMSKPYFSHDIASRGDIKIKRLLHEQGYEGYQSDCDRGRAKYA